MTQPISDFWKIFRFAGKFSDLTGTAFTILAMFKFGTDFQFRFNLQYNQVEMAKKMLTSVQTLIARKR